MLRINKRFNGGRNEISAKAIQAVNDESIPTLQIKNSNPWQTASKATIKQIRIFVLFFSEKIKMLTRSNISMQKMKRETMPSKLFEVLK